MQYTYTSDSPKAPFLLAEFGLGFGLSSQEDVGDMPSIDVFDPRAAVHMGVPLGKGFTLSLGVEIQYIWQAICSGPCRDSVLFTSLFGFGFFDPNTAADDHALSFLGYL